MTKTIAALVLAFSAVLSAPVAAAAQTDPSRPVLLGGKSGQQTREWVVTRPSRGAHASAVRSASQVPDRWRSFASCVLSRESGGTLADPTSGSGARNPASSAQGRWQFLDSLWRPSLAGQVAARLMDHGMPKPVAHRVRSWLQSHAIATWPGVLQDVGFIEVLSRGGSYHWRQSGSRCEQYR